MKKTIAMLGLALLPLGSVTMAQNVPAPVKAAFQSKFPGVTPQEWEKEDGNYEAEWKVSGVEHGATFKADGTFLEEEVSIAGTALPADAIKYIRSQVPGAKISEACKITMASGQVVYEAEVGRQEFLFDEKGKHLKSKVEDEDDEEEGDDD